MHRLTLDMVVADQDYEDNRGSSDWEYFWDRFVRARQAWRDAGKPS